MNIYHLLTIWLLWEKKKSVIGQDEYASPLFLLFIPPLALKAFHYSIKSLWNCYIKFTWIHNSVTSLEKARKICFGFELLCLAASCTKGFLCYFLAKKQCTLLARTQLYTDERNTSDYEINLYWTQSYSEGELYEMILA